VRLSGAGVSTSGGKEACKEIISEGGCIGGGGTLLASAFAKPGGVVRSSPGGPESINEGGVRPGGGIILPFGEPKMLGVCSAIGATIAHEQPRRM